MIADSAFWSKVAKRDDCWEWQGHRDPRGYGRLSRHGVKSTPILAHRYSWYLTTGQMPSSGQYVCHHCDNPPCVNPAHLFLGAAKDNNDDKLAKGRGTTPPHFRGHEHPCVVIPDAVVREARESFAAGRENQKQIAARLVVSPSTVRQWMRGAVRTEAGGPVVKPRPRRLRT